MEAASIRHALWPLILVISLCRAQSSVPVATEPIVSAVTVSTTSLLTIYSVVTSTQSVAATTAAASTIVTNVNGRPTTITVAAASTGAVAQPVVVQTNTIISTITADQVVMSTVGFSTVYGAVPNPTTSNGPATESVVGVATPTQELPAVITTSQTVVQGVSVTSSASTSASESANSSTGSASSTAARTSPSATHDSSISSESSSSSSAASVSSPSHGLSTGAKAGIGIGVALGVVVLAVLSFLFGQRFSRRRQSLSRPATDDRSESTLAEKETFKAGRPYEFTGSLKHPSELAAGKIHPHSLTTTEIGSATESMSGRSYEPSGSAMSNHNDAAELSALPQFGRDDGPTYIGVPAHMSGTKRWSMKEYERS